MVAKKVTTRRKIVEPPPPSPSSSSSAATKSFPTAMLGIGMVILTNYQAEVKQLIALLLKALT
jgi:hypothetical protein